ncbi:hypothetical protein [Streptomyces sp. ALB3]|uniref:hypothetical protein n=1 Tax=Streptomyces sp. ALB3 TaxID=3374278 RepID=UPI0037B027AF
MDSTAGAVITSSVMLSTATLVAAGLFWVSSERSTWRRAADGATARQEELREQVSELCDRVGALQRLLEGAD